MLDILKNKDISVLEEGSIDLLIESYSNSERIIQIRGLAENSQIIADHTTNSDRSLATSTVSVTSIPITLTLRSATAGVKRGECYVKVSLRVEGVVVALLMAGYVTETGTQAYPNGKMESSTEGPGLIRSIAGTDPAAGAEISETVPTGAKWRFIAMVATLVTDATVANRLPQLRFQDGTLNFLRLDPPEAQAASGTFLWGGAGGTNRNISTISSKTWNIPKDLILPAGYKIATGTSNIQAGDNWGAPQMLIEEWIQP